MTDVNVVAFGDTHINSKVGLRVPRFKLDDGDTTEANEFQVRLWEIFLEFARETRETFKRNGGTNILILTGDMVDIDYKKRSTQIVSNNTSDILRLAVKTLEPFYWVDKIIFIRGTEAHAGPSADHEEALAGKIKDKTNIEFVEDDNGNLTHWAYRATIAGYRFDLAHHTSMGGLPWTESNAANKLAAKTILQYAAHGKQPPNFILRGHVHRFSETGDNYRTTRAYTMPCFGLQGAHAYRIGAENRLPDLGGLQFIFSHNNVRINKRLVRWADDKQDVWGPELGNKNG